MSSSKTRRKSALLAYGVSRVMCFACDIVCLRLSFVSRLKVVKIDNQAFFFYSQRLFFCIRLGLASASSGKSLQHMPSKNACAGKLCTLLHEIENRIFSLAADHGQAAQVDY